MRHRRGRVFLLDAFQGHQEWADSVNCLENPANFRQAIEVVSDKLRLVLLVLGLTHFFNRYVFSRIRKRSREHLTPPPFRPDAMLATPGRLEEG